MKYKTKEEVSGMMFGKGIFEELLKIAEGHKDIDFWDEELLESYNRTNQETRQRSYYKDDRRNEVS